ncbi:anti-sigma factor [Antarctobacter jejuensis]|uniref:anti-sigma factor n=1 Tax=Antarctobacter jejuensis TaxID=1439938 RepID=UPI003FCEEC78
MSTQKNITLPGGFEAAAAEYALGLMPKEEIEAFETRLAGDIDLQQDVAAWTEYFATFTDPVPQVAPPPQVLRRIESRIFGNAASVPSVWRQVLPYLVGAVAGVVIAWIVFTSGMLQPARPTLQAELTGAAELTLSARFDPETGVLTLDRLSDAPQEGRVLELWLLPEEGAPVSLALLRSAETLVAVPPVMLTQLDGARLMVSEEPAGGAPDGAPSGAARAEGRLEAN